jgi:hypothetical protein
MDTKLIPGIIGAIGTILGGAFTLVGKLNNLYRKMVRAEEQVGTLGKYYRSVRVYPITIMWWTLLLLCLLGLLVIFEGVAESMQFMTFAALSFLLQNYLILPLAFASVFICAYFDLPTRVLLFLHRMKNPNVQFDPGYINARWQLDDPSEIMAMNYEPTKCSILGVAIMDLMETETTAPAERAPVPAGISDTERANYIFFGCVIEHWVHKLINDRTRLNEMWKYLAWAASSSEKPFTTAQISAHSAGYFEFLRDIKTSVARAEGDLPVLQEIKEAVDAAAGWLVKEWSGDAGRLATSNIFKQPSPQTLLENLENASPFSESDGLRRLYLKLSARMRVWPQMDPGPFLYPFYSGIALLLLNADCILVSEDIDDIQPHANEGFRSLVASAEDKVIRAARNHLLNHQDEPQMQAFSTRVFACAPKDVDEWSFFDYVDLWLFTHARRDCTVRTREKELTPCSLKPEGLSNCFCVTPQVRWQLSGHSLVKGK